MRVQAEIFYFLTPFCAKELRTQLCLALLIKPEKLHTPGKSPDHKTDDPIVRQERYSKNLQ